MSAATVGCGRSTVKDPTSIIPFEYPHPDARFARIDPPRKGEGIRSAHTNFTFFSGRLRTGLPVAAKIAFITEGATTQIVGSPMPPQKS